MTWEQRLLDEAVEAATMLLGAPPRQVTPVAAGANSRIYQVQQGSDSYALKRYPTKSVGDPRDRQGCERRALELMREQGIATVPRFITCDQDKGFSLLEWIDGERVSTVVDRDAVEAGIFLEQIASFPHNAKTRQFPLASEACLSGREILRQVTMRRERLEAVGQDEPVLASFFAHELTASLDRCVKSAMERAEQNNVDVDLVLDEADRRLIPADFGFHNVMRLEDGSLRFIDFEYFGWDDPVKLSVDFLVHPSVELTVIQKEIVHEGLLRVYGSIPEFEARLNAWMPLLVARWALIMLNIFLPNYQQARSHLRAREELSAMQAEQVRKVRKFLRDHAAQNGYE